MSFETGSINDISTKCIKSIRLCLHDTENVIGVLIRLIKSKNPDSGDLKYLEDEYYPTIKALNAKYTRMKPEELMNTLKEDMQQISNIYRLVGTKITKIINDNQVSEVSKIMANMPLLVTEMFSNIKDYVNISRDVINDATEKIQQERPNIQQEIRLAVLKENNEFNPAGLQFRPEAGWLTNWRFKWPDWLRTDNNYYNALTQRLKDKDITKSEYDELLKMREDRMVLEKLHGPAYARLQALKRGEDIPIKKPNNVYDSIQLQVKKYQDPKVLAKIRDAEIAKAQNEVDQYDIKHYGRVIGPNEVPDIAKSMDPEHIVWKVNPDKMTREVSDLAELPDSKTYNQTVLLGNGTIVLPDGTKIYNQDAQIREDGSIYYPKTGVTMSPTKEITADKAGVKQAYTIQDLLGKEGDQNQPQTATQSSTTTTSNSNTIPTPVPPVSTSNNTTTTGTVQPAKPESLGSAAMDSASTTVKNALNILTWNTKDENGESGKVNPLSKAVSDITSNINALVNRAGAAKTDVKPGETTISQIGSFFTSPEFVKTSIGIVTLIGMVGLLRRAYRSVKGWLSNMWNTVTGNE